MPKIPELNDAGPLAPDDSVVVVHSGATHVMRADRFMASVLALGVADLGLAGGGFFVLRAGVPCFISTEDALRSISPYSDWFYGVTIRGGMNSNSSLYATLTASQGGSGTRSNGLVPPTSDSRNYYTDTLSSVGANSYQYFSVGGQGSGARVGTPWWLRARWRVPTNPGIIRVTIGYGDNRCGLWPGIVPDGGAYGSGGLGMMHDPSRGSNIYLWARQSSPAAFEIADTGVVSDGLPHDDLLLIDTATRNIWFVRDSLFRFQWTYTSAVDQTVTSWSVFANSYLLSAGSATAGFEALNVGWKMP